MIGPSSQISKLLLSLLFLCIIFFIFMDVELYLRIQNYSLERNYNMSAALAAANYNKNSNNNNNNYHYNNVNQITLGKAIRATKTAIQPSTSLTQNSDIGTTSLLNVIPPPTQTLVQSAAASSVAFVNGDIDRHYDQETWISCDINPLCHVTVKALLLDHTNHYLFAPLATIFDDIVGFSRSNFITPNMISFFHVGVAIAAGKLVSSDSLGYRRLGVILFQFRTFLDDLDGHVARAKRNIKGEHSEVGTAGYYIDGICDGLGCIALLIGIFVYLRNNPPRRGYTQLPLNETKLPEPVAAPKTKLSIRKICKTVAMFAGLLLLSSTAWNRYIAVYQDTLESNDVAPNQFIKQNIVFRSAWFFSVAWLWRIVNVHSLLHYVLLSIFCDKLWDFLKAIQYSGYVILVVVICYSEMHLLETHHFIFNSMIGST